VTTITTVKRGWSEQYGLHVYELEGQVGKRTFRATRCVSRETFLKHAALVESSVKAQVTEDVREHPKETE
jgi:hypothetical protein